VCTVVMWCGEGTRAWAAGPGQLQRHEQGRACVQGFAPSEPAPEAQVCARWILVQGMLMKGVWRACTFAVVGTCAV
jgi:hypothetical protein